MGSSPPPPFSSPSSGEESSSSNADFLPFPVPPPLPGAAKRGRVNQINHSERNPSRPMDMAKSVPPPPIGGGERSKSLSDWRPSGVPADVIVAPPPVTEELKPSSQSSYTFRVRKKTYWAIAQDKVWEYLSRHQRQVPSWMISLCVHTVLILVLALIPIITQPATVFNLLLNNGDGGDGDSPSFDLSAGEPEDFAVSSDNLSMEAIAIESTLPTIQEKGTSLPEIGMASHSSEPLAISMGLSGRNGSLKDALLGAYGGNAVTENAVDLGLQWLARNQARDGSWSLKGPFANGSSQVNKLAATSMALIAFAGAGNTHQAGKYKDNVAKGVKQLISWQDNEGRFNPDGRVPDQHLAYSHAQATIALCELYGMTRDYDLKKSAQLAVNSSQDWQDQEKGGWRYTPRLDSDLSVTGWFVMALVSARMAGLSTDEAVLKRADKFLDTVSGDNGSTYYYVDYAVPDPGGNVVNVDLPMTAEGLLCRLYLGWAPTDPKVRRGASYLITHPISIDVNDRNYYYWYYCTQTMHHIGDPLWTQWNDVMKDALPDMQIKSGKESGSWPSQGDPHDSIGGRLYSTCLAIYCLEVYYRHLPLYNSKAQHTFN